MRPARVTQPRSPQATPRPEKKRELRMQQTKTVRAGLEGFVDWTVVIDNEPVEEEEMFSLSAEFATRIRKRPVALEGEAASSFGEK